MRSDRRLLRLAVISLAVAVVVAGTSMILATRLRLVDHLPLFNALAAAMLAFGIAGLACSVAGAWRARFRRAPIAITGCLSLMFLIRLMLDG